MRGRDAVIATMHRLEMSAAQLADALSEKDQKLDERTVRRWVNGEREPPPYLWRALRDLERERKPRRRRQVKR